MHSKSKKALSVLLVLTLALLCLACGAGISASPLDTFTAEAAAWPGPSPAPAGAGAESVAQAGRSIYVAPGGNDSTASGSMDAPYKSINTALAAAAPGDTIILRGGTYREGVNVRVRQPNITIKSQPGEWAVIDLTTYNRGSDEDSGVYFDVDSSGGRLQGVEVMGGFYAVCMETTFRWDPADPFTYGASNIIIEDCKLHDSRYDVVKVKPNCNNITIRNNEIYNSGRAFIGNPNTGDDNAEGIDNVNGANMTVQGNHIHDVRGTGIYAKGGAADALIENNRVERILGGGILVGFDTSPEWFNTKVNPKYYENIRGVVRNNLILETGWEGIGFYGSSGAQVYNNTLVNVNNGGLYHSAIYFGLTYQDWEDYAGRPATVNPHFHHNIVCQPASFGRNMIEIRYSGDLGGMSALDGDPLMNDNCYFIAGKSASFTDNRPRSVLESGGLKAWQAHINGDSGSIEADPALGADYMPANPQCAGMGYVAGATSTAGLPQQPPAATATAPAMANFKKLKTATPGMFRDVDENAWYGLNQQKAVASAYEYGLMKGISDSAFNPSGNVTVAEAIAIAARVHSIYSSGTENFKQGSPWYQVYVDYAAANGVISAGAFADYARAASRAEMAGIFSRALPAEGFKEQNTVNSLPDVDSGTPYSEAILLLYKAGVLTGSGNDGAFFPHNNITRAEAAAIISRVILPDTRAKGKTY